MVYLSCHIIYVYFIVECHQIRHNNSLHSTTTIMKAVHFSRRGLPYSIYPNLWLTHASITTEPSQDFSHLVRMATPSISLEVIIPEASDQSVLDIADTSIYCAATILPLTTERVVEPGDTHSDPSSNVHVALIIPNSFIPASCFQ